VRGEARGLEHDQRPHRGAALDGGLEDSLDFPERPRRVHFGANERGV
jgi:hypothetical protein